jgi:hypothetical protein
MAFKDHGSDDGVGLARPHLEENVSISLLAWIAPDYRSA